MTNDNDEETAPYLIARLLFAEQSLKGADMDMDMDTHENWVNNDLLNLEHPAGIEYAILKRISCV